MRFLTRSSLLLLIPALLSSCWFGKDKGPIDQERSQLSTDSRKMSADGQQMIKDGQALQNRARESRVVAASNRQQAEILMAQGKTDEANQLQLQATQQEADAAASDDKGRALEAQGLKQVGAAQDTMNRSNTLGKQGEQINGRR
jgi:hypothetical protein